MSHAFCLRGWYFYHLKVPNDPHHAHGTLYNGHYVRAEEDVQSAVRAEHQESWERWMIDTAPRLGFLIDLLDERTDDLPVLEFIQHRVPIYFPYDDAYRPRPPLARRLGEGPEIAADNFVSLLRRSMASNMPTYPAQVGHVEDRSLLERWSTGPVWAS